MLRINNIFSGYGDLQILSDVSFELNKGEIVSIIGPNGAGKTTLMRTVLGEILPSSGNISLEGNDITNMSTEDRVNRGLSLVPEEQNLFRNMTVRENLVLGSYTARGSDRTERIEGVYELFPRLEERKGQRAGTLSGGEAQMLTIGRALMANPRVLLLDEPSIGLAPKLVPELFDRIETINNQGVSIVLVEQRVNQALELSDRGYLLEDGQTSISGNSSELLADEQIVKKYMGGCLEWFSANNSRLLSQVALFSE